MKEIAKALLKIKAVSLSPQKPFTWASGIKSPIYCDNRLVLSFKEERELVELEMVKTIQREFPEVECLMGTAAAGIPHASICAWEMGLPTGFVRGKVKDHGKENQIEGKYYEGMKTVVVEDLISTGGSSFEAVKALRNAGCDVLGIISIFTYEMKKAEDLMAENHVKTVSLTNYHELLEAAVEEKYIDENELNKLKEFMKNPSDESWMEK